MKNGTNNWRENVAGAVLNENGAEVRWTGKNGEAETGPPSTLLEPRAGAHGK
jgi:hypothetical protein